MTSTATRNSTAPRNDNFWKLISFILICMNLMLIVHLATTIDNTEITQKTESVEVYIKVPVGVPVGIPVAAPVIPPPVLAAKEKGHRVLDFYKIAKETKTDKVAGVQDLENCLNGDRPCRHQGQNVHHFCKTGSHFYHELYNFWVHDGDFMLLEIGFKNGKGHEAFHTFLPSAEIHSFDIACWDGWDGENLPQKSPRYQELLDDGRLHCGDASNYTTLEQLYHDLNYPGAPPLQIVVDDASHKAKHMMISMLFWFPRLPPGGLLIIEDIHPLSAFTKHVLPQLSHDVHQCGIQEKDKMCFPTVRPLLKSFSCYLHICVLERNSLPANAKVGLPPIVWDAPSCLYNITGCAEARPQAWVQKFLFPTFQNLQNFLLLLLLLCCFILLPICHLFRST